MRGYWVGGRLAPAAGRNHNSQRRGKVYGIDTTSPHGMSGRRRHRAAGVRSARRAVDRCSDRAQRDLLSQHRPVDRQGDDRRERVRPEQQRRHRRRGVRHRHDRRRGRVPHQGRGAATHHQAGRAQLQGDGVDGELRHRQSRPAPRRSATTRSPASPSATTSSASASGSPTTSADSAPASRSTATTSSASARRAASASARPPARAERSRPRPPAIRSPAPTRTSGPSTSTTSSEVRQEGDPDLRLRLPQGLATRLTIARSDRRVGSRGVPTLAPRPGPPVRPRTKGISMPLDIRRHLVAWSLGGAALLGSGALAAQASAATLTRRRRLLRDRRQERPADVVHRDRLHARRRGAHLQRRRDGRHERQGRQQGRDRTGAPTPPRPSSPRRAPSGSPSPPRTRRPPARRSPRGRRSTSRSSAGSTAPPSAEKGLRALTEKTNWSFSGFQPGKPIFGHYLYKGKQVALATFGRAQPPCGTLKVRARLYPATPHHASYSIQYDDQPRVLDPVPAADHRSADAEPLTGGRWPADKERLLAGEAYLSGADDLVADRLRARALTERLNACQHGERPRPSATRSWVSCWGRRRADGDPLPLSLRLRLPDLRGRADVHQLRGGDPRFRSGDDRR